MLTWWSASTIRPAMWTRPRRLADPGDGRAGRLRRDGTLEALARMLEEADDVPASFRRLRARKGQGRRIAGGVRDGRRCRPAAAGDVRRRRRWRTSRSPARRPTPCSTSTRRAAGDNDPAWPTSSPGGRRLLTAASPYRPERREDAQRDEAWLEAPAFGGGVRQGHGAQARLRPARCARFLHPYRRTRRRMERRRSGDRDRRGRRRPDHRGRSGLAAWPDRRQRRAEPGRASAWSSS